MDCRITESAHTPCSDDVAGDIGNFGCHICFELPLDPVVTLCGHLYCRPCLYQWLHLHSHYHECPVCKAVVEVEKLIPIYGRGRSNHDPRSHPIPVPNPPMTRLRQTPRTPHMGNDFIQANDLDPLVRFMPMAAARYGHAALSTLFRALPSICNRHFHGLHNASVGSYLFSTSYQGIFALSFHHRHHLHPVEWKHSSWKTFLLIIGIIIILHLILS